MHSWHLKKSKTDTATDKPNTPLTHGECQTFQTVEDPLCTSTSNNWDVRHPIAVFLHGCWTFQNIRRLSKHNQDKWPIYLPRLKSCLAIHDNFIGFSSSHVSHDFIPKYFTQTVDIRECSTFTEPFAALTHTRLLFKHPIFGLCKRCITGLNLHA